MLGAEVNGAEDAFEIVGGFWVIRPNVRADKEKPSFFVLNKNLQGRPSSHEEKLTASGEGCQSEEGLNGLERRMSAMLNLVRFGLYCMKSAS